MAKSNKEKFQETLDYADDVFLTRLEERIKYFRTTIDMIVGVCEELRDGTIADKSKPRDPLDQTTIEGRVMNQHLTEVINRVTSDLEIIHDILLIQDQIAKKMRAVQTPDDPVPTERNGNEEPDPAIR